MRQDIFDEVRGVWKTFKFSDVTLSCQKIKISKRLCVTIQIKATELLFRVAHLLCC